LVDAVVQVAALRNDSMVSRARAEDVVYVTLFFRIPRALAASRGFVLRYQMFEINMDEYLDEEVEALKHVFDVICRDWEKKVYCQNMVSFLRECISLKSSYLNIDSLVTALR